MGWRRVVPVKHYVHLETACGATRIMEWWGHPGHKIRVPLRRELRITDEPDILKVEPLRTREFEESQSPLVQEHDTIHFFQEVL